MGLRRKIVRVSDNLWALVFGVGDHSYHVGHGLPPDARLVGARKDVGCLVLCFESEDFPETEDGSKYPDHDIMLVRVD